MKKILSVLSGKALSPAPLWMMRQAGRYLPEYRAVREKAGSFLNLVYNPDMASDVTIQPLRRFDLDAAILFSDILVVPQALGADLWFETGEGPRLTPLQTTTDLNNLTPEQSENKWAPVIQTIKNTKATMKTEGFDHKALIGFCGGPFTVACYMVQGHSKDHDFESIRNIAYQNPVFFNDLINIITNASIEYLSQQIEAGADLIQIFESWASVASGTLFDEYVIKPTKQICDVLSKKYPGTPMIGFPRGAGSRLISYTQKTGIQGVGIDYASDIQFLRSHISIPMQGNLDPLALLAGGSALDRACDTLIAQTKEHPHIFNLGHGILPATPIEHVHHMISRLKGQ
jgi:uroporphyrinogen decarboxylase